MCTIGHYKTQLPWILRIVALVGAVGLLDPGTLTDVAGLAVLVILHVIQTIRAKKQGSQTGTFE